MGVPFLKFPIIFGVGAVVILAMAGCKGSGASGGSVATVGKDPITEKEFYDYLQRKPVFTALNAQGQAGNVQLADPPGYQALKDLIINKVIFQLAKEQNVYPSDKDVDTELTFQREQQPKLIDDELARGLSLDDIKNEVRLQLANSNLQTKGQTETAAEATAFIKANPTKFMDPPLAQAQMVVVGPADGVKDLKSAQASVKSKEAEVDAALASGQPFGTVAKTYTAKRFATGLEANGNDFRYRETNENKMPAQLKALFDKTDELKTTPWQPMDKTNTVFVKFYIVKKVPVKPTAITPTITEKLRRLLLQQKGQKAGIDLNKMILQRIQAMKDTVKINIKQDQTMWTAFVTQVTARLAQAAGTEVPGTPAPGGAAASGSAPATTGSVAPGGAATPSAPATSKK